jgi:hypothetical protein
MEKQIQKMTKVELMRVLLNINPELYFMTRPRLTSTKSYRFIVEQELNKLNK